MRPLPNETETFKPLYDMLTGHIRSKLLWAALDLKIFDILNAPCSGKEVAAQMSTHKQNTCFFLDALAHMGLIEKSEGQYQNSPLADQYLVSDSTSYLGPLFRMTRNMSILPLDDIEALVRNGPRPPVVADDACSQCQAKESARASAPWALGEMGRRVARMVSHLPGFSRFKKMLDLGGGHGLFALYITQANPDLHAMIFDREPVADPACFFNSAPNFV